VACERVEIIVIVCHVVFTFLLGVMKSLRISGFHPIERSENPGVE